MKAYALLALVALSLMLATSAHAQGIFDARDFIRRNPGVADFAYDIVRDILRLIAFITTLIAIIYPFFMPKKAKLRSSVRWWLGLASIPILIQLLLTSMSNSFFSISNGP
jgi:hypothetical protein